MLLASVSSFPFSYVLPLCLDRMRDLQFLKFTLCLSTSLQVLIMDKVTVKVMSSTCKMADITDQGVSCELRMQWTLLVYLHHCRCSWQSNLTSQNYRIPSVNQEQRAFFNETEWWLDSLGFVSTPIVVEKINFFKAPQKLLCDIQFTQ